MARQTDHLGLSERWSLARSNVGSPISVIYHASLPAGLVTEDELKKAVSRLCEIYPILLCGVEGRESNRTSYRPNTRIKPHDLVKVVHSTGGFSGAAEEGLSLPDLVGQAVLRGKEFDVESGPMWEIQLHRAASSSTIDSSLLRDRLVLLIDHILCDGLGARNLFADLLSVFSETDIPDQPKGLPGRMDDSSDLRPPPSDSSYWNYLQSYLQPLINRFNPLTWLNPSPSTYTVYPRPPAPDYNSVTASQQFSQFELEKSQLSGLLAEGKKHKVATIHPVIHVAALVALYRASTLSPAELKFSTSVPISERKEDLGHPRSTGNYVTFHFSTDNVSDSTLFWEHTRSFDVRLRDPNTKPAARQALGKIGLIAPLADGNSGWENFLKNVMSDPNGPHKLSLAVSNVGLMDLPSSGKMAGQVKDVYFTQGASAMGACAVISIMSTRGGSMTVSISSKVGSLPDGVFDNFTVQLKSVLQAISRGDVSETGVAGDSVPGVPEVLRG